MTEKIGMHAQIIGVELRTSITTIGVVGLLKTMYDRNLWSKIYILLDRSDNNENFAQDKRLCQREKKAEQ